MWVAVDTWAILVMAWSRAVARGGVGCEVRAHITHRLPSFLLVLNLDFNLQGAKRREASLSRFFSWKRHTYTHKRKAKHPRRTPEEHLVLFYCKETTTHSGNPCNKTNGHTDFTALLKTDPLGRLS